MISQTCVHFSTAYGPSCQSTSCQSTEHKVHDHTVGVELFSWGEDVSVKQQTPYSFNLSLKNFNLRQPEHILILQKGFDSLTIYKNTTSIWILTPSKWWKANKPAPPGLENHPQLLYSVTEQSHCYQWCIAAEHWCLQVPLEFWTVVEKKDRMK